MINNVLCTRCSKYNRFLNDLVIVKTIKGDIV